ncbi:hypothetical protein GCM10027052_06800 [Parafrigoribacterium mesophilum]|uniref:LmeA family phospholipid-binding protein n=1 Tax=Parafrigoribacterium mesophilum TaxID=433646 RepID=UPI0031FCDBB2
MPPADRELAGRPRRRRGVLITILIVVLAVIVAGVVVLDGVARSYAADQIEQKIRTEVGLGSETPLTVKVGGFSVLAQLATGALDDVQVSADGVALGEMTGSFRLRARGLPIDTTKAVQRLTVDVRLDAEDVKKVIGTFGTVPLDSLTIGDGALHLKSELRVFASLRIPVGLDLTPGASNGEIALTPTGVDLAGKSVSAADVKQQFPTIGDALFQKRTFCIADKLPSQLVLDDARVSGSDLVLSFAATGLRLDAASLAAKGTCPSR